MWSISVLLLLFSLQSLTAQIFADFTVSQGTGVSKVSLGTFRAELAFEKAPRPVANFIGLGTGQRPWIDPATGTISHRRYYDGLTFHRLDHTFVIQGGDILGTGGGSPGFVIQDQFNEDLRHSGRYILSMAKRARPNSNGAQFFITLRATPNLDDKHSVFGEVITGREIIDNFADPVLFPTLNERPVTPITLDSLVFSGPDLATFDLFDPTLLLPEIRTECLALNYEPDEQFLQFGPFSRETSSFYRLEGGTSLADLNTLGTVFSADSEPTFSLFLNQFSSPSYFARLTRFDYSLLPNPAPDLLSGNPQITIADRNNNALNLSFTDATTGTWSHSDGGSGNFTVASATDGLPNNGDILFLNPPNEERVPLFFLTIDFDSQVGPENWQDLDLILSFHTATTGWVEGSAELPLLNSQGQNLRTAVLQSFTYQ